GEPRFQTQSRRDGRIQSPARQCRERKTKETKSPLGDGTTNFDHKSLQTPSASQSRSDPPLFVIGSRGGICISTDLSWICYSVLTHASVSEFQPGAPSGVRRR